MKFAHQDRGDLTQGNRRVYHLLMVTAFLLFATDPIGATDFASRQQPLPQTHDQIDSAS